MSPVENAVTYTTGQVAAICGCAPRTVTKWCDAGTLRSWRLPDCRDRRVEQRDLIDFMVAKNFPKHMIPVPETAEGGVRESGSLHVVVMAKASDSGAESVLREKINARRPTIVREIKDWFTLGMEIGDRTPHAVVVVVNDWNDTNISSMIDSSYEDAKTKKFRLFAVVAIAPPTSTAMQSQAQLNSRRWNAVFRRPLNMDYMAAWLASIEQPGGRRVQIPEPVLYPPV